MLRRKLREPGSPISFFAFQDIITSVSGILIIVTLILALDLGSANPLLAHERATADQEARLAALLDELSTARRAAERDAAARGGQASAEELNRRAAQMQADAAATAERNGRRRSEAAELRPDASAEQRARAFAQLSAGREPLRGEIKKLEAMAAARAADAQAASRAAEQAQAAVLAEQERRNVLRLIPEPSATDREPVIAQLAARRWTLQRFDTREKSAGNTLAEFRTALGGLSALKQYVVFYGKPSATDEFEAYVDSARNAGFGVGYDLVPEETEIELHPK